MQNNRKETERRNNMEIYAINYGHTCDYEYQMRKMFIGLENMDKIVDQCKKDTYVDYIEVRQTEPNEDGVLREKDCIFEWNR